VNNWNSFTAAVTNSTAQKKDLQHVATSCHYVFYHLWSNKAVWHIQRFF